MLLLALIVATSLGVYTIQAWNRQTAPLQAPARAETRVPETAPTTIEAGKSAEIPGVATRTDEEGNPIEISGPHPRSVLLAFCDLGQGVGRFEPMGLMEAPPPHAGVRLGVYRDLSDLSATPAIRIRKDPRTRRWVSGDGRGPIAGVDVSMLAAGRKVVPVTSKP